MPDKGRIFHFWFDCETTGLDLKHDHVLEIGWTITDDEFRMLTPLRQRFVDLSFGERAGFHGEWDQLNDVVFNMHSMSGLIQAWDDANPMAKISDPQGMVRLFKDDLVAAGFNSSRTKEREPDKLVLSGAGVSHFDDRMLAMHAPFFYPSPNGFDGIWAYWRTFDTSTLWRGLGDKFMNELRTKAFNDDNDMPYSVLTCENPGDKGEGSNVAHLTLLDSTNTFRFDPFAGIPHRAADDVVDSLLTARVVRALGIL